MDNEQTKRPSKKHMALTFCIGLAFLTLIGWLVVGGISSFIGLFRAENVYAPGVTTDNIVAATALQDQFASAKSEEEYFEYLLANFVKQDAPPFNNVNELESEYIISYGLWQTISLNNSQGVLATHVEEETNTTYYYVPRALVEKMAKYYVDYTDEIEHQNVSVCGEFEYNSMDRTYTIVQKPYSGHLMPKVVSVETNEDENTVVVTVDCYEHNDVDEEPTAKEVNFRKRNVFTLKKVGNTVPAEAEVEETRYQIVSMRLADKAATTEEE